MVRKNSIQQCSRRYNIVTAIHWSADGGRLYISGMSSTASWAVFLTDLTGNTTVLVETPARQGWVSTPLPSPDGHFLAYDERIYESNVTMLQWERTTAKI